MPTGAHGNALVIGRRAGLAVPPLQTREKGGVTSRGCQNGLLLVGRACFPAETTFFTGKLAQDGRNDVCRPFGQRSAETDHRPWYYELMRRNGGHCAHSPCAAQRALLLSSRHLRLNESQQTLTFLSPRSAHAGSYSPWATAQGPCTRGCSSLGLAFSPRASRSGSASSTPRYEKEVASSWGRWYLRLCLKSRKLPLFRWW